MYEVAYKPSALKALLKMPKNQSIFIRDKIDHLRKNPYAPNNNVKKLKNVEGYRLCIDNWRVIYHVNDKVLEILIVKIALRGEIYQ